MATKKVTTKKETIKTADVKESAIEDDGFREYEVKTTKRYLQIRKPDGSPAEKFEKGEVFIGKLEDGKVWLEDGNYVLAHLVEEVQ